MGAMVRRPKTSDTSLHAKLLRQTTDCFPVCLESVIKTDQVFDESAVRIS